MMSKPQKQVSSLLEKALLSRFNSLLLISMVISQVGLTHLAAQGQTSSATYQYGCGLYRPFMKGYTSWSGQSSFAWGTVESNLDRAP
jgi:hypothetical protein